MLRALFAMVLASVLVFAAPPVRAETLTNDSVVELAKAGLGADAIVAKIRASASRFDVSTDALVLLKRDSVPDPVIAAMIEASAEGGAPAPSGGQDASADPTAPHSPGIYLLQAAKMQRLDPTLASDAKTANVLGWILTYGAVPLKVTTVLAGPTAPFSADSPRPSFYFYFNQPGSGLYQNGLGMLRMPGPAPSPQLFSLIHFQSVGGNRQALTQVLGMLGQTHSKEVDATIIDCHYTGVSPGVFKLTPDADLPPGEYAFAVTPEDSSGDDEAATRYFDFSVTAPAPG